MSSNPPGRPTLNGVKLTRVTVFLTPDQFHAAYMAGNGKFSEGLRKQLDELESLRQWARSQRAGSLPENRAPRARHQ